MHMILQQGFRKSTALGLRVRDVERCVGEIQVSEFRFSALWELSACKALNSGRPCRIGFGGPSHAHCGWPATEQGPQLTS